MLDLHPKSFINIKQTGFGCRGSFTTLYMDDVSTGEYGQNVMWIGDMRGEASAAERNKLAKIVPMWHGHEVPYVITVTPSMLTLNTNYGWMSFCYQDETTLRVRGEGLTLQLRMKMSGHESARPKSGDIWEVVFRRVVSWALCPIRGTMAVDCPYNWHTAGSTHCTVTLRPDETGFELALTSYQHNFNAPATHPPFDECERKMRDDYEAYAQNVLPSGRPEFEEIRRQAAWLIWMCNMPPHGFVKTPLIYMARQLYTKAFGWQPNYQAAAHSANALTAWHLVLSMFYNQDEFGQLPDSIDGYTANYSTCKPPIQGVAIEWLMRHADCSSLPREEYEAIYTPLIRWTEWWFTYRDSDHDGIPSYEHGDEAGGDHISTFSKGLPVSCAELCAYLAVQMDVIGVIAGILDKPLEQAYWKDRSEAMVRTLIEKFWDGNRFVPYQGKNLAQPVEESMCISAYIPLVLGRRLPREIMDRLAEDLTAENQYLCCCGVASESLESPDFECHTGWDLGLVDAPNQFLIAVGLESCGKMALARKISTRFCDAIRRHGFYSNFHPVSGRGIDRRFLTGPLLIYWTSWAAAVYLVLQYFYDEADGAEDAK